MINWDNLVMSSYPRNYYRTFVMVKIMPTLATDETSLNVDELAQDPQPGAIKTAYLKTP